MWHAGSTLSPKLSVAFPIIARKIEMGVLWYRHRFAGCAADPESSMATPAQAIGRRMEIGILRHFHRNAFFNGAPISALALPAATIVAFDDEPVLRNHYRVAGLVCGAKPGPQFQPSPRSFK